MRIRKRRTRKVIDNPASVRVAGSDRFDCPTNSRAGMRLRAALRQAGLASLVRLTKKPPSDNLAQLATPPLVKEVRVQSLGQEYCVQKPIDVLWWISNERCLILRRKAVAVASAKLRQERLDTSLRSGAHDRSLILACRMGDAHRSHVSARGPFRVSAGNKSCGSRCGSLCGGLRTIAPRPPA